MYHKRLILFFGLICLICGYSNAGYTADNTQQYTPRVGEVLKYKVIAKSLFYGANQTMKVVSKGVYANRNVFNVEYTLDTIGLVWSITKYREREELILDEEGLYPLYTKREIYENEKLQVEETSFDYTRGYAIRNLTKNGKSESYNIKLPGFVQDNLSLEFFLRKGPLEEGRNKIYFYSFGQITEIDYEVTKVNAPLKLECGSYSQYYQIESDVGKTTVLLADNPERLPLIIRKIAGFGKVEAQLSTIN